MASSQQLSTLAESLASRAPALMQAKNDAAREEQLKQLKDTQAEAMAKIKQLAALRRMRRSCRAWKRTSKTSM